jgi:hypothetical protein
MDIHIVKVFWGFDINRTPDRPTVWCISCGKQVQLFPLEQNLKEWIFAVVCFNVDHPSNHTVKYINHLRS